MRTLTTHHVSPANRGVTVQAVDDPGPGGASRHYRVQDGAGKRAELRFTSADAPGVTHEAILAVLIDRLEGFEAGPCPCRENQMALLKLRDAMHWLRRRHEDRAARGVGGTMAK